MITKLLRKLEISFDVLHKIWALITDNILSLILKGTLKAFGITYTHKIWYWQCTTSWWFYSHLWSGEGWIIKFVLCKCYHRWKFSQFPISRVRRLLSKLEDIIVTASIVFDGLNKLKTDKSPGPEGWPIRIFKECSKQLSTPLSSVLTSPYFSH